MLISPVRGAPHAYFQLVLVKLCMVFNNGTANDIIISDKIWKQHIFRHAKYPNLTVKLPKQGSKFYSRLEKKGSIPQSLPTNLKYGMTPRQYHEAILCYVQIY